MWTCVVMKLWGSLHTCVALYGGVGDVLVCGSGAERTFHSDRGPRLGVPRRGASVTIYCVSI